MVKTKEKLADSLFLDSATTQEIIQKLYAFFEKTHKNPSLENFSRAVGIPSKGYLSNVLSGNIVLGEKHIEGIGRYFSCSEEQLELLVLMSKLERKKKEIFEINLEDEIKRTKKIIATNTVEKLATLSVLSYLIFNLVYINKTMTRLDIGNSLPGFPENRIDTVLQEMLGENILLLSDSGELQVGSNSSFYIDPKKVSSHDFKEYLDELFSFIKDFISLNYKNTKECLFESSVITVKKTLYQAWLKDFKKRISQEQASIQDDEDPDQLICFNVEVFQVL